MRCGFILVPIAELPHEESLIEEESDVIRSSLPEGIAEKILAQKKEIEGKRKKVTIMLCVIDGFASVFGRIGRDKVHSIMDQVYEIMTHHVLDKGGIVNKETSDGIMAIFGAPLDIEDAPQQAIKAALAIHQDLTKCSDQLRGEHDIRPIAMRAGIHTGYILIHTLKDDLRIEFSSMEDTVNLALAMEKLAEPNTTNVSEETYRLTEHIFHFYPLGEKQVNGDKPSVKAFRVIAYGNGRSWLNLGGEWGTTPFVDREKEIELQTDAREYKESCSDDISLNNISNDPLTFKDRRVKYQGVIERIFRIGGATDILLNVTGDANRPEDSIFIWYKGKTDILESDTVQVWGQVRGSYVYTSVAGWRMTLPLVMAEYIELVQPDLVEN
jgi:class 3 adenylate cyclase